MSSAPPAVGLEPAPRNPRALRNTALALVAMMAVGAVAVLAAYQKFVARQRDAGRPAFAGRVVENLAVVCQDGKTRGLLDLRGQVWVVAAVAVTQPEGWQHSRAVLERLDHRYRDRDDFHIVCLTVDPEHEPPPVLAGFADRLGAAPPRWWFAAAGEEFTHKYLKDKLKLGPLPSRDVAGRWRYDTSLAVIDRDLHLRRAVIGRRTQAFDFDQAARWDAEGRREGIDGTNAAELERRLVATIDYLLDQPARD